MSSSQKNSKLTGLRSWNRTVLVLLLEKCQKTIKPMSKTVADESIYRLESQPARRRREIWGFGAANTKSSPQNSAGCLTQGSFRQLPKGEASVNQHECGVKGHLSNPPTPPLWQPRTSSSDLDMWCSHRRSRSYHRFVFIQQTQPNKEFTKTTAGHQNRLILKCYDSFFCVFSFFSVSS